MIFQPILPWWGLVILFTPPLILCLTRIVINRSQLKAWLRRLAILALIFLCFLGPSLPHTGQKIGKASLDVYFIVDTTYSAKALDYNGNKERIEGMRQDIKDIASKLAGARFSLILFDYSTYIALPLTNDTSALASALDTIIINPIFFDKPGSSIDAPLETTEKELQRITQTSTRRGRILFYLGDGEQTANSKIKSFEPLKNYINGGGVLGYGTPAGGKMRNPVWKPGETLFGEFLTDPSSDQIPSPDALSKIDENNLRTIASQLGVTYFHRTAPGGIDEMIHAIDIGKITSQNRDISSYSNIAWLIAPLIIIVSAKDFWNIYYTARRLRTKKKRIQS